MAKVSGQVERTTLGNWVHASVDEMDAIVHKGFPGVFGDNWRNKMSNFPTAARTKLLTYIFDYALEKMARRSRIKYRAANNEGPSETNNFDCYIFGYEVENKLSLGKSPSSFATGSSHNTDNKVPCVLAVKIQSEDYRTKAVFAAFVDLSMAIDEDTKWHAGGNSGFSTLKIACADANIIVPICGGIHRGQKYVNVEYEPLQSGE